MELHVGLDGCNLLASGRVRRDVFAERTELFERVREYSGMTCLYHGQPVDVFLSCQVQKDQDMNAANAAVRLWTLSSE